MRRILWIKSSYIFFFTSSSLWGNTKIVFSCFCILINMLNFLRRNLRYSVFPFQVFLTIHHVFSTTCIHFTLRLGFGLTTYIRLHTRVCCLDSATMGVLSTTHLGITRHHLTTLGTGVSILFVGLTMLTLVDLINMLNFFCLSSCLSTSSKTQFISNSRFLICCH